jgi:selenocysteine lyase/cysteine desulfurase
MDAAHHAIGQQVRSLFSPEGAYLNTATYGLPPRAAFEALERAADEWRHGRRSFEGWDMSVGRARAAFACIAHVDPADVAVGAQVSPFVGLVAVSLPRGARVLCAEGDFTSLLFPFLVQEERGVSVRSAPPHRLAEATDADTDVVACSAVQSADGAVADLDALAAAADHHGATVVLDTTQAMGWLPIDCARFGVTICGGYKWLLNPRGTAFMTIRPQVAERVAPHAAGWYAAAEPLATYYGEPLRLADDARRFDHSPAWLSWVGAAPALELLADLGPERIQAHDVALAARLCAGLGLAPAAGAIVSVATDDGAADRLRAAGVMAAGRAGRLRFSCHLYNDEQDVDRALEALAG